EGAWQISLGTTTLTQAGATSTALPGGSDTFASQTSDGTIAWTANRNGGVTGTSLRGFVNGAGNDVTVCVFGEVRQINAASGVTACVTQDAVLYSLTLSPDGQTLDGKFLIVDLAATTGSCGVAGNFIFGTIRFRKIDADTP